MLNSPNQVLRLGLLAPVFVAIIWLPLRSGGSDSVPLIWIEVATFACLALASLIGKIRFRLLSFWITLALILTAAATSTAFSKDLDASVPAMLQWLWLGAVVLLITSLADPPIQKSLMGALIGAAVIQAFWGFFVWWGGGDPADTQSGTFYAPNQYAGYLLLLAPMLIAPALMVKNRREAAAWGLMASFICVAVTLSGSRGGLVALGIGSIATVVMAAMRTGPEAILRGFVLGAVAVALGLFLTGPLILSNQEIGAESTGVLENVGAKGSPSPSTEMRVRWVEGAMRIGVERPVTGSGLGTYGDMLVQVQEPSWFWSRYAHNHYAEAFAEGGVPLAVGVVTLPLVALLPGRGKIRGEDAGPQIALIGGLLAGSAHLVVDHDWSFPAYAATFVIMTALLATSNLDIPKVVRTERSKKISVSLFGISLLLIVFLVARERSLHLLSLPRDDIAVGHKAKQFAPYSATAHQRLAQDLLESGNRRAAARVIEKAITLDELEPRLRWQAGEIYVQLVEIRLARRAYREAIIIAPNAPPSYELAARFELNEGDDTEAAARILDQGLARLAQHPYRERLSRPIAQLLVLRADSAERLGDSEEAFDFAKAASNRDPTLPEAWLSVLMHSCAHQRDPVVQRALAQLGHLKVATSTIDAARENCG